ncbi:DNA helicase B-like isoform X2 [Chanodichthys erythropterus]|uniref:DNA helicase B-like isoform X2 n=1 Tax=Chanodichthys erythropterus TaxID=933992 RepID=UPI00351DE577
MFSSKTLIFFRLKKEIQTSWMTWGTHENKICFQVGDKVCCTKNGYISGKDEGKKARRSRSQRKKEQMKNERMYNGEIFFIKKDVTEIDMGARSKTIRYLTLDDENGHVVTFNYSELQRECKLRHAWGSEAETIVYVLRNNFAENWQHVYTAVTRGQKCVYVVGTECDLEGAIKKWIPPRNTQLCGLLKAIVAQQGPEASKRHAESDPCTKPSKLVKVTNL